MRRTILILALIVTLGVLFDAGPRHAGVLEHTPLAPDAPRETTEAEPPASSGPLNGAIVGGAGAGSSAYANVPATSATPCILSPVTVASTAGTFSISTPPCVTSMGVQP